MQKAGKRVGLIGIGSMGGNVAERLYRNGYSLVLYNQHEEKYEPFRGRELVDFSSNLQDFAKRMGDSAGPSIIWVMVPGGAVTNSLMSEISPLLRKGDVIIDASNSLYTDSVANHTKLKKNGIFYLDVGCAGGPDDVMTGVSLYVGGDEKAFKAAEDVFKIVSGSGAYGYLGESGSGHMAKMIHNGIFYGIFPVYAEGVALMEAMSKKNPKMQFKMGEALRLLQASPPVNTGIAKAISDAFSKGEIPESAPVLKISEMVNSEVRKADELGIGLSVTKAALAGYASMSERSRAIYTAAKRILTGH